MHNRKLPVMCGPSLARHHTPVTTDDELCHLVEPAWASVLLHATQSLFDSMPGRISAVVTVRGGGSGYTGAFGDGPRNFEPWSRHGGWWMTPELATLTLLPNHTTG
ncbi:hypothetical protein TNCV_3735451 [Trichonephila clavipes]|nr:hypothetical protein TNCV_3735451 [Trichonephila clavipes]